MFPVRSPGRINGMKKGDISLACPPGHAESTLSGAHGQFGPVAPLKQLCDEADTRCISPHTKRCDRFAECSLIPR